MTTRTSELDRLMNSEITSLSERTDEELQVMQRIIERAYTHVQIERGLRSAASRS